jgi:hypothetical protein
MIAVSLRRLHLQILAVAFDSLIHNAIASPLQLSKCELRRVNFAFAADCLRRTVDESACLRDVYMGPRCVSCLSRNIN